ncbi:heavy-metal-associated domain-containing protein [Streptomyces ipomoeae]|jgi:copper chaperone CopZ|uniref:Heavy-metal-associated domain-containing protein n=1 Tax=Streptomyces ipomoeae TaxID=103232 RepID=A0AAE8W1H4_9ACTN|nr:heavy metal-associated domain-containing protein [Streptomyces ipomoeae]MDX2694053.1 heavy metal-associated domain-containing protein [Streptomyces ipomoeae]MDX2821211.1 heavy metal-associated domain-containing protein [Streptomyces ipomoeae]MDX2839951.1 heavy metal-associated domain-containing protein [Streptomyces ipomoeae]MDX2874177.1 heavy metal-associated domain-containing protein [Streptomyces ipomoeae]TQE19236.1 heavy-metal-associated domain-containing protein [Streptomyces ipomoeae]
MSCCSSEGTCSTNETTESAQATGTTTVYSVTGMTCGHCEQSVGSAISSLDGVTDVKVDVTAGLVTVTSVAEPDDARVRAAVDEAGYELAGRAETSAAHH